MKITNSYTTVNENPLYESLECELDKNTILSFEFDFNEESDKKCIVKMTDKVSGIVDVSSRLNYEDSKDLIRVLRTVSMQLSNLK